VGKELVVDFSIADLPGRVERLLDEVFSEIEREGRSLHIVS
jgi:hypothetical protein